MDASHPLMPEVARVEVDPHRRSRRPRHRRIRRKIRHQATLMPFAFGTTTGTAGSPVPRHEATASHRSREATRPIPSCATARRRRRSLRVDHPGPDFIFFRSASTLAGCAHPPNASWSPRSLLRAAEPVRPRSCWHFCVRETPRPPPWTRMSWRWRFRSGPERSRSKKSNRSA